jgi:hypothetical protein
MLIGSLLDIKCENREASSYIQLYVQNERQKSLYLAYISSMVYIKKVYNRILTL